MLKLTEERRPLVIRHVLAGQRVSKKYRQASIRKTEYRRLKAIVPSIANKRQVSKVKVVEEAIKYIDELHRALFTRVPLLAGRLASSTVDPSCAAVAPADLITRMFPLPAFAVQTTRGPSADSAPLAPPPQPSSMTSQKRPSVRPLQPSNGVNRRKPDN